MSDGLEQKPRELVESTASASASPSNTSFYPNSVESLETIYDELRSMAAAKMARERPGHTLCPTALVNEAYVRLRAGGQRFKNRRYFFGAASEAMRRILVERARFRQAAKRGGGIPEVPLEECEAAYASPLEDDKLLQVHEALDALEKEDAVRAEIVKLLVFVGLNQRAVARLLELNERKVRREWREAKTWLYCSGLPAEHFHLSHARLLLVNLRMPQKVIEEMVRVTKAGGVVALQAVDWVSWICEPMVDSWIRLKRAARTVWQQDGLDVHIGRRLPAMLRQAGLSDIETRIRTYAWGPDNPKHLFLLGIARRIGKEIVELGLLSLAELERLTEELEMHLHTPGTMVLSPTYFQVWGRKPIASLRPASSDDSP